MCGLAGFISHKSLPASVIGAMTDLVRHRGPDDEGFVVLSGFGLPPQICGGLDTPEAIYIADMPHRPGQELKDLGNLSVCLALGHRRLSIVDLSQAGHQPMCTTDHRFWIVYNGEVYNHIELRRELEERGHVFRSHSDTEVILEAFREWGVHCLHHFNGMFAFLLYDSLAKRLFAARDRFGVKPLYYWISPAGDIAFGSEIKQFTVLPGWHARMNGQRVYDFLVWAIQDHTDETMFNGVYQVPPGHYLELDLALSAVSSGCSSGERLPARQWYSLPSGRIYPEFEEASSEFQRLLVDSVSLRSRADVPIGSCLSGGLDSSSIVCILNKLLAELNVADLQKTFSACSDVNRFDEREWIDRVAAYTEVDSHYVYPAFAQLFAETPAITWHQDEPFGTTSIYAQWNVFRLASANGVKVMLDGQGADELLAGYHSFFPPYLAGLLVKCDISQLIREMKALSRIHGYSLVQIMRFIFGVILPHGMQPPIKRMMGINAPNVSTLFDAQRLGAFEENVNHALGIDTWNVNKLSRVQLCHSNLPMLLHWEDRDSMAHGVESRLPFLDYHIVEYVLTLPDKYKISEGTTKRLLRDAMRGILPDTVRDRSDKIGFATAEEVWMKENRLAFREKLMGAVKGSHGILRPSVVDMFDDIVAGRQNFNFMIWRIISFGEWNSCFSVVPNV